ncbi:MAG: phosphodiesterase [Lachnospiraceae bacterium]|nr:phosphodiesterase [Lachnospiraceae bacterium]
MKWLIASDIHGSEFYCSRLTEAYKRENADRLLLLGDLLYHGPRNDLPKDYAPKKVAEMLNGLKNDILCVRGNCEAEVDQMMLEFPIMADYALIPLGKRAVFATHGHLFNKDKLPPLKPGDILLYGHTHIPLLESVDIPGGSSNAENDEKRSNEAIDAASSTNCDKTNDLVGNAGCDTKAAIICMNPGSVSIPKNGSEHSYMILDMGETQSDPAVFEWKTLEGGTYKRYEINLRG